jgi:hypothetical protein
MGTYTNYAANKFYGWDQVHKVCDNFYTIIIFPALFCML